MTEQKNHAPQPISDEDLDSATGGAIGLNPLLLLASGAHGIYAQSTAPAAAPVTHGANPLYVESAHVAGPSAPVLTPAHDVVPAPTHSAPIVTPAHDVAPVPTHTATQSIIAAQLAGLTPMHTVTPTPTHTVTQPTAAAPVHESSVLVVNPSGMGQSLDIPSHPPSQIISHNVVITGVSIAPVNMAIDTTPPPVTVMTFAQNPGGFTQIIPTVHPLRSAGYVPHAGVSTPLENAFDLHLVNK